MPCRPVDPDRDDSIVIQFCRCICYVIDMAREKLMSSRKIVSLPSGLGDQIENYWFENRMNTEAEAVRRLIVLGLEAAKTGSKGAAQ
jgi:hypothetical protein